MDQTDNLSPLGMEENLKKALTEMLILALLGEEDMHSAQITQALEQRTGGALSIVFPYAALYRLINAQHICEAYKKPAPDGRRRQYFQITAQGREYLSRLIALYRHFIAGVDLLLQGGAGDEQTKAQQ